MEITTMVTQNAQPVKHIGDLVDQMDGNLVTYTVAGKRQVREVDGRFAYTGTKNRKRFFRQEAKAQASKNWAYDLMAEAEEWSKQ